MFLPVGSDQICWLCACDLGIACEGKLTLPPMCRLDRLPVSTDLTSWPDLELANLGCVLKLEITRMQTKHDLSDAPSSFIVTCLQYLKD